MPRIRSVKPDFFTSESIGRLAPTARLSLIGLFCWVDDEGRHADSTPVLNGALWAHDDDHTKTDMENELAQMEAEGIICRYQAEDGKRYLHLPKFRNHQVVNRPSKSRIPPCPRHNGPAVPSKAISGQLSLGEQPGDDDSDPDPDGPSGGPGGARFAEPRPGSSNGSEIRETIPAGVRGSTPAGPSGGSFEAAPSRLTESSRSPHGALRTLSAALPAVATALDEEGAPQLEEGAPQLEEGVNPRSRVVPGSPEDTPVQPASARFALLHGGLHESSVSPPGALRDGTRNREQGTGNLEVEVEVEAPRRNETTPDTTTGSAGRGQAPAAPLSDAARPTAEPPGHLPATNSHDDKPVARSRTDLTPQHGTITSIEDEEPDMGVYDKPLPDPFALPARPAHGPLTEHDGDGAHGDLTDPGAKPKRRAARKAKPKTDDGLTPEYADDARAACAFLAERVAANGAKATVTEAWLTEAERLLRLDGRALDEIVSVAEWATENSFWRANILSMPKLREKFDRLRLDDRYLSWLEARQRRAARSGSPAAPAGAPARAADAPRTGPKQPARAADREFTDADYAQPL